MKYLSEISSGETVRVLKIDGGAGMKARLAAIGMTVGQRLTVISNGHPGPFIVRVKEAKMILGRGMARHIMVSEI